MAQPARYRSKKVWSWLYSKEENFDNFIDKQCVGDMNLGLIQPGAGWNKNATTQPMIAA